MKILRRIFSQVLDIPVDKLSKKSSPKNISTWDSVNNLILISEIEKEYDFIITIEDVYKLNNLGDVYKLIKKTKPNIKF